MTCQGTFHAQLLGVSSEWELPTNNTGRWDYWIAISAAVKLRNNKDHNIINFDTFIEESSQKLVIKKAWGARRKQQKEKHRQEKSKEIKILRVSWKLLKYIRCTMPLNTESRKAKGLGGEKYLNGNI